MAASDIRKVLLIHGLFMPTLVMRPLGSMLVRRGYQVEYFGYPSTGKSLSENAANLVESLNKRAQPVDIVGHSLGCLVALDALHTIDLARRGKLVALTPPFQGSAVGRVLNSSALGKLLLGAAGMNWESDVQRKAPTGCDVGIIAGTRSFGAGQLITKLPSPHDGTVAVQETALDGSCAHVTLPVTHTGVLLSSKVAQAVDFFLKNSAFV